MKIESEIQRFIAENFLFSDGAFEYESDTSFLREGIIDSLGVMELVTFVETQYQVRVAPQEVTPENFDSVNNLARYIRSKQLPLAPGPALNTAEQITL
jgi:acyl carrier protein